VQISLKHLALLLCISLTFIPYTLLSNYLSIEPTYSLKIATIVLQILCVIFVIQGYLRTTSRSLGLFWQFFAIAVSVALISTLFLDKEDTSSLGLLFDFASLFSYFFILLALETNPHLSETPINKYISGRVPAILFTLVCFSYFVLLPAEFANDEDKKASSTLFNIVIISLIFFKLVINSIYCRHKFWLKTYGLLSISALAILIDNITGYFDYYLLTSTTGTLLHSIVSLLPYAALIFAANLSLNNKSLPKLESRATLPERYILLLVLVSILIHVLGIELALPYVTPSYWQPLILVVWLVVAFSLVILIAQNKRRYAIKYKSQKKQLTNEQFELIKLNQALTNSIINSEDKAIVSASNNAILTTSTTGKILSANPAAVQMFQSLEQELTGSNVKNFFSPDDQMHYFFDFKSNVFSLQRKETGISVECISQRSDGTEFPVQTELQWADREDTPLIVITFINLTARKLAEKQALDLKDKFIANISHEFRTPLTIINGILDQYLAKASSTDESKELTTAKRNGLRLVRMVEQLLELSRLSDNPKLALSHFKLSSLMAMPNDSFFRLAKQSNLTFSSNIPEDLWLECDAQAFEKIIFNLIANAIKYTPAGGSIQVNGYQENDTIMLDIIDTGIGIKQTSQAKIFERFQRADDEKNQAVFGVGIGLSLVSELVKAHNWRINIVSEYNKGSKFTLSIPLAQGITQESKLPVSLSENEVTSLLVEQGEQQNTQHNNEQNVVLVIEDNLDMQSHIKKVIEQQHHCLLTTSGEQGITLAQEFLPDLIVCDIMLTGIDGFEVLQQIKQNELTSHIPIILLTARSDLDSRLHGLNLQADEYLSKPFNQQELLTRIENLIENRKQLQKSYLQQFNENQKEERKDASVQNAAQLTATDEDVQSIDDKFLEKLETVIAKMYTEPELGIVQLASEMAMSERQLQRKIKVLLGTTPNNFIKEFRLIKAKALLKSGYQIGRIALDVGFSSQTYFGRCFKESFNCTPKQYQQKNQSSTSAEGSSD